MLDIIDEYLASMPDRFEYIFLGKLKKVILENPNEYIDVTFSFFYLNIFVGNKLFYFQMLHFLIQVER